MSEPRNILFVYSEPKITEWVKKQAEKERRSVSQYIMYLLEKEMQHASKEK